mmetsp:Transcript_964/g.1752  ORF Transcript_964/g.1752 Transcript_964/m.1752 type:complete len:221 (-) Transcript_964:704-1366(-)|eukprot:CAMPEP_0196662454 /NCGR_PEP_ID=MMETSP1086-20130531/48748_1 /TAXON_ID=77921 /ORGANISM="Cyanoptyche  gloeocystis , Strain SAG4.97" /LENGTH=220 /DNA_ID=CAMNT_0041997843 /DNA_START=97 /DNA_END=759 /DNA_ORIENTATION=-
MVQLFDLPDDLLLHILGLCGTAQDLCSLQQVCRYLQILCSSKVLWRNAKLLCHEDSEVTEKEKFLTSIVPLRILVKAVDAGNLEGMWILSRICFDGKHKSSGFDYTKGIEMLRQASVKGFSKAQYDLALHFARVGNDAEYIKWIRRASEQGHRTAQNALALAYACGTRGLKTDLVQFHKWCTLAGSTSQFRSEPNLSPQQISQALEQARSWRPTLEVLNI